jgi:cytochrome c553
MRKGIFAAGVIASLATAVVGMSSALAQQSEASVARYAAANCANCHGTAGVAQGAMPSLAGQKKEYIAEQVRAFRDGKRPATIMHQLSKGYSDAQIDAMADYFARQPAAR